ncbi:MAG: hypothetical protein C0598_10375 [Marinilabiliales bacterium]|nr:MAG: hypothetical protein C0598_10375 [Marinilabiliales bacterium]
MSTEETIILKKQIKELLATNKRLNSKLEEAETMKTHFISNVMNEIYNPFASIISMAENIYTLSEGNLHKANDMAKIIVDEAQKLDFHLKNLFAAARLEAGVEHVEYSKINLNDIIPPILKTLENEIKIKDLEIVYQENFLTDNYFKTDRTKFILIMENLINNALKFSKDGTKVEISLKRDNYGVKLDITNIPQENSDINLEEIFDRFKRGNSTINSVSGGNGLGLSIVKEYIDMINGSISIFMDKSISINIDIPDKLTDLEEDDDLISEAEFF